MNLGRKVLLGLLSALALSVLVGGTAMGWDTQAAHWVTPHMGAVDPTPPQSIAVEPTDERVEPAIEPVPEEAPAATGVELPDVEGLRVSTANRRLRALGLEVRARDDGYRLSSSEGMWYRVQTMSPAAGSRVEPGTRVEIEASAIAGAFASDGY